MDERLVISSDEEQEVNSAIRECPECQGSLSQPRLGVSKNVAALKQRSATRSRVGFGAYCLAYVIFSPKSSPYIIRNSVFKIETVILTYITYCCYHLSRKPISVVKTVLQPDAGTDGLDVNKSVGWEPFNHLNGQALFSGLDSIYLFSYAIGMFISGHLAERFDLRYFLCLGALLTSIFTAVFGWGFYLNIHNYWFFFVIQLIAGFFQSSGWPAVVTCLGNWFGKRNRGFVMGLWNSHVSVGNILGSVVAGIWVETQWGLSFIVPAAILAVVALIDLLFLVPFPEFVDCDDPETLEERKEKFAPARPKRLHKFQMREGMQAGQSEQAEQLIHTCSHQLSDTDLKVHSSSSVASAPPVSFMAALRIPGVVSYSLCLFFNKLVSYTFLFWLPVYIQHSEHFSPKHSANLSTLFDFGGIIGCIVAGAVTDYTGERASVCAVMLALAAPALYMYLHFGAHYPISSLFFCGILVNGPYGLITTAVAADLGTHPSVGGSSRALATVTAIIDGTGSVGAALGPLMAGVVSSFVSWHAVLYVLIAADLLAFTFLFLNNKSLLRFRLVL